MSKTEDNRCHDFRPCFARNKKGFCKVLQATYKNGKCPFCKPSRNKRADGSDYPFYCPDVGDDV